jgi:hypothetical protein
MTFVLTVLIGMAAAATGFHFAHRPQLDPALWHLGGLFSMLAAILLTLRLRGYESFGELFAGTMASFAGIAAVGAAWMFFYRARQSRRWQTS